MDQFKEEWKIEGLKKGSLREPSVAGANGLEIDDLNNDLRDLRRRIGRRVGQQLRDRIRGHGFPHNNLDRLDR